MSAIIDLFKYLASVSDFERTRDLMDWDQMVNMPPGGANDKAHQITALSEHIHALGTSAELGKLIAAAEEVEHEDKVGRALVRTARRNYDLETKLPAELVKQLSQAQALAHSVWEQAKKESNFAIFAPSLEKNVALMQRMSEAYGYENHPYDPLLDQFEQGATTAQVDTLFAQLRTGIVPLVQQIKEADSSDRRKVLRGSFNTTDQLKLGRQLIEEIGFDFTRGRMDVSTHPFCVFLGIDDVRVTTRVRETEYWDCISSIMHETGHALYEQGIDHRLSRMPLGAGVSLGVHESQSRLWENMVGMSKPFWQKHLDKIHQAFPQTKQMDIDQFYTAINTVAPTFIRTEADEVTYNLHVIIRFELEKAMVEGSLKVADLPEAWNTKYQEYLGITPPDDARGILQDMHWAVYEFGYFPTYGIGNVLSVQLYNAAIEQTPGLQDEMAGANYDGLRKWLQNNIYTHGGIYTPKELVLRATGGPLDAKPYLAYLEAKYSSLYNLQ